MFRNKKSLPFIQINQMDVGGDFEEDYEIEEEESGSNDGYPEPYK